MLAFGKLLYTVEFVHSLVTSNGHMFIFGEFSVHWDSEEDTDAKYHSEISMSANLIQHVDKSSHGQDNILPACLFFLVSAVSHRKCRLIDIKGFLLDLNDSRLLTDLPKDLDQLVDRYDSTFRRLIHAGAPLGVRKMPQRALIAWHNNKIFKLSQILGTYCERLSVETSLQREADFRCC